jgi:hypothetical protein
MGGKGGYLYPEVILTPIQVVESVLSGLPGRTLRDQPGFRGYMIYASKVKKEDHERAVLQFQRTLDHFKAGRAPLRSESEEIWKMLASGIDLFEVVHAISGMRFEPNTESYDPAKHVNIYRIWDREKRAKLVTLSTQEQAKRDEKKRKLSAT